MHKLITHQHVQHAERDIVLPVPFFCPSVRLSRCVIVSSWLVLTTFQHKQTISCYKCMKYCCCRCCRRRHHHHHYCVRSRVVFKILSRPRKQTSLAQNTRSSADADNGLDAFSGQSRSTNMVPFHMLHMVSYCTIVTLSLRRAVFTIFVFKKFHDLIMGSKITQGH